MAYYVQNTNSNFNNCMFVFMFLDVIYNKDSFTVTIILPRRTCQYFYYFKRKMDSFVCFQHHLINLDFHVYTDVLYSIRVFKRCIIIILVRWKERYPGTKTKFNAKMHTLNFQNNRSIFVILIQSNLHRSYGYFAPTIAKNNAENFHLFRDNNTTT